MRVLDKSIYAYEVQVETSRGVAKPIFTFDTSIKLEDVEDYPLRMRIRAYFASFHPHSVALKLSQPGDWSDWSDWVDGCEMAFSEARDSLASVVDPQQQAPGWALKLK